VDRILAPNVRDHLLYRRLNVADEIVVLRHALDVDGVAEVVRRLKDPLRCPHAEEDAALASTVTSSAVGMRA